MDSALGSTSQQAWFELTWLKVPIFGWTRTESSNLKKNNNKKNNKQTKSSCNIRAHALYSTVDGSRKGYSWLVRKKKIKNKICLWAHVGKGEKMKGKFHEFYLIFGGFNIFFT